MIKKIKALKIKKNRPTLDSAHFKTKKIKKIKK